MNLPQVVGHALARINALLPVPPTHIALSYSSSEVVPQTGTSGSINLVGRVALAFGPTPASLAAIMRLWLPRTFSHEIDHSFRALAGPGLGLSLLDALISEGISTALDVGAFPGTPDPWERAISLSQECALWGAARPLLAQPGLYDKWMIDTNGIPHWAGFAIGYHIVADYLQHHPGTSWPTLTATSSTAILAGSHYQPCGSSPKIKLEAHWRIPAHGWAKPLQ
jgi:uncharacterized protein YjaZ